MRDSICDRAEEVIASATSGGELPSGRHLNALVEHAQACQRCSALFDGIKDPATALAMFQSLASEDVEGTANAALQQFEANKRESLRSAVRDVLLPSLGDAANGVADLDSLVLVDAIEAVSLLLYREIRRRRAEFVGVGDRRQPAAKLFPDGHVEIGRYQLPKRELSMQIAHLAEIHPDASGSSEERDLDGSAKPDPEYLATWMFAATIAQPLLFPHLRADARVATENWVGLQPIPKPERITDPGMRWEQGALLAGRGARQSGFPNLSLAFDDLVQARQVQR